MGITDPAQEYFKDGGWSWTGTEWIKGGLAFEYAEQLLGRVYEGTAPRAWVELYSGAVPAGEIWVVTALSMQNANSITSGWFVGIRKAGTNYWLAGDVGGAAPTVYAWSGVLVAAFEDQLVGGMNGCTVGDDVIFCYAGYKMRLT